MWIDFDSNAATLIFKWTDYAGFVNSDHLLGRYKYFDASEEQ